MLNPTTEVTLTVYQRIVHASVRKAIGGSYVVTLPEVGEAAGLFFYVKVSILDGLTVTVEDNGDDAGLTDIVLDGNTEHCFLFSTGKEWIAPDAVGYA